MDAFSGKIHHIWHAKITPNIHGGYGQGWESQCNQHILYNALVIYIVIQKVCTFTFCTKTIINQFSFLVYFPVCFQPFLTNAGHSNANKKKRWRDRNVCRNIGWVFAVRWDGLSENLLLDTATAIQLHWQKIRLSTFALLAFRHTCKICDMYLPIYLINVYLLSNYWVNSGMCPAPAFHYLLR